MNHWHPILVARRREEAMANLAALGLFAIVAALFALIWWAL